MKSVVNVYVLALLFLNKRILLLSITFMLVGIALLGFSNSNITYADMEAKLATSNGSDAFVVQNSSGSPLMSIFSNGNVGIGTIAPEGLFQVKVGAVNVLKASNGVVVGSPTGGDRGQGTINAESIFSSGNIGIGTTSPGYELDVAGDINFTGSLYQNGSIFSGGSGAWTTSGSYIYYNSGKVGIGTTSPQNSLQIHNTTGNDHLVLTGTMPSIQFSEFENGIERVKIGMATTDGDFVINSAKWDFILQNVSGGDLILATSGTAGERMRIKNVTGNIGIGTTSPNYPLEMGSGAHVTSGGVWTNASSREYKNNIRNLTYEEAKTALEELTPTRYHYNVDNEDEYLGFIAEDVPDLVATKDRKGLSPMDIVAVLTKVVQQQQSEIEELKALFNNGQ